MSIPTVAQVFNPLTGVLGNGFVQTFSTSGTWVVPAGVTTARVRMWGAGGGNGGCGGGFALRTLYGLVPGTAIPVSVPLNSGLSSGGTASFGTYVSATGGLANNNTGPAGTGIGGDVNTSGGLGALSASGGGGGVGSFFGTGGNGSTGNGGNGASGGGGGSGSSSCGGAGALGAAGSGMVTNGAQIPPTSGIQGTFSIDLIGTGGGGGGATHGGINGGGGSFNRDGGFPGGGGGGSSGRGAAGLVIVEW